MIEEPFATGDSLLHRRDPRVKILTAIALTVVVALTSSFAVAAGAGALALALVLLARLPVLPVLRHLLAVNVFTLFLWLTLPLTYGGETTSIHGLTISASGIRLAALITIKSNTIVLALTALLSTSTIAALGHGLEGLGIPPRLCFMLLTTYRYLFVIHQEYQRLYRAAIMRGFVARTNLHTYKTLSHLFAMTLVKSWNRAHRVHQAMLLRGFSGQLILLRQPHLNCADYLFLASIFLLCCGLAGLHLL